MLAATRKKRIKDLLTEKKSVTVSELSDKFNVTEETIRRDLNALHKEGALIRTHGGAFIQEGTLNEINYNLRETDHIENKRIIGRKCAQYVQNGDSIFLDSSTTASFVAEAIRKKRITVLTDSLKIANMLSSENDIHLIVTGGEFSQRSNSFIGTGNLMSLNQYYVDSAFISCRYVSMQNHITDSNDNLALIRQKILERSNKTFLIADYSKFDKTSFYHICNFDSLYAIVTDKPLSPEWHSELEKYNVIINDVE
jgi:DeoR/GlpR family transcriptional regulator of sugar metabolism